jgi:hypothetical protein
LITCNEFVWNQGVGGDLLDEWGQGVELMAKLGPPIGKPIPEEPNRF